MIIGTISVIKDAPYAAWLMKFGRIRNSADNNHSRNCFKKNENILKKKSVNASISALFRTQERKYEHLALFGIRTFKRYIQNKRKNRVPERIIIRTKEYSIRNITNNQETFLAHFAINKTVPQKARGLTFEYTLTYGKISSEHNVVQNRLQILLFSAFHVAFFQRQSILRHFLERRLAA